MPAAADVSTVDTLPADTARRGEGRCRAVGRRAAGGESAEAEMGQQQQPISRLARRTDRYSHGGIRFRAALTGAGEVIRLS